MTALELALRILALTAASFAAGFATSWWVNRVHRTTLAFALDRREQDLETERARYEVLLGEYVHLRNRGYDRGRGKISEAPDVEAQALARAETIASETMNLSKEDRVFIDNAKRDIMARNPGISSVDAEREARKLRQAVTAQDPPA